MLPNLCATAHNYFMAAVEVCHSKILENSQITCNDTALKILEMNLEEVWNMVGQESTLVGGQSRHHTAFQHYFSVWQASLAIT